MVDIVLEGLLRLLQDKCRKRLTASYCEGEKKNWD